MERSQAGDEPKARLGRHKGGRMRHIDSCVIKTMKGRSVLEGVGVAQQR